MIKLICGRSRAGKTTYCKRYPKALHLDYGWYPTMLKKVSEADGDVIIEGIYDTAERRKSLLNAFNGDGKKICVWLDTPLDVIDGRFNPKHRPHNLPHPFEPPTLDEGWDEIIIIRGNNEQRINRQTED